MTGHPPGDPDRPRALYHPDDEVCLGGVHAVWAIEPDGRAWPWLVGDDPDDPGCFCRDCAPHEQTGRLPATYRRRINACRATAHSGQPCRNPAPLGADYCGVHRDRGGPS